MPAQGELAAFDHVLPVADDRVASTHRPGAGRAEYGALEQVRRERAGIVRLDVAAANADRLEAALRALSSTGLSLSIERGTAAAGAAGGELIRMELLAHDRPGIVRDISSVLAQHGASIERMDSACESASFSGEAMFRAEIEVRVPASVPPAELQAALESLANELMVDLKLEAGA